MVFGHAIPASSKDRVGNGMILTAYRLPLDGEIHDLFARLPMIRFGQMADIIENLSRTRHCRNAPPNPAGDHGTIETPDGREIYLHRNRV